MLYSDSDITINREYIILHNSEIEAMAIKSIQAVEVKKEETGNYRSASILFFILGILSFWFLVGFLFLAWGAAAWNSKTYRYILLIKQYNITHRILVDEKQYRVGHCASIIKALKKY